MNCKMTIEIWSDVMCPFCYLGKKNLEEAINLSNRGEDVNIEWKSFQLNPNLGNTAISTYDYLAQMRGLNVDEIKGSFSNIEASGKEKGIDFNFETALVVNTAAAHRFIQLAKEKGKGNEAEEALFKAQFSDGRNVSSPEVLEEIGLSLGFTSAEIDSAQTEAKYQSGFEKDLYEAQQIGVRGVPFFVFDRKYAVSGAQPVELFVQTLEKSLNEQKLQIVSEGDVCDSNGNCN
jgi:predicted DsbA family dithiol-disulfide isomerase